MRSGVILSLHAVGLRDVVSVEGHVVQLTSRVNLEEEEELVSDLAVYHGIDGGG